jgi:hypothetical protein
MGVWRVSYSNIQEIFFFSFFPLFFAIRARFALRQQLDVDE